MWYWIAEPFLYTCLAIVAGYVLLGVVPERDRPVDRLPVRLIAGAALGIGFFALFPVLRIVGFFAEDVGYWETFRQVLSGFTEGKAYLITVVLSLLLTVLILRNEQKPGPGLRQFILLLVFTLITVQGWSSHVASLYGTWGILSQTLHLIGIALWAGPLLLAGWSGAMGSDRWLRFVQWYHPLAAACMAIILASGFVLMFGVAPEYVNAWQIPYGQALLIKHVLILPLAFMAIVNGFWVKRRLQTDAAFRPRTWARVEGIVVLLIFAVTGFMNQQAAPHDVSDTLQSTPASSLYLWFSGGSMDREAQLAVTPGLSSIVVWAAAALLVWTAVLSVKRKQAVSALLWSLLAAALLYYGFMLSVV